MDRKFCRPCTCQDCSSGWPNYPDYCDKLGEWLSYIIHDGSGYNKKLCDDHVLGELVVRDEE